MSFGRNGAAVMLAYRAPDSVRYVLYFTFLYFTLLYFTLLYLTLLHIAVLNFTLLRMTALPLTAMHADGVVHAVPAAHVDRAARRRPSVKK